jgi:hypothetical protein
MYLCFLFGKDLLTYTVHFSSFTGRTLSTNRIISIRNIQSMMEGQSCQECKARVSEKRGSF